MVSLISPRAVMPPPPTPLQKRPTLGLKRDSSYLDTDDEAGLSTSTKKLKVTFSPTVDVRIMEDANDKSFELVKEEVSQAIERHLAPVDRSDNTPYARLVEMLSQDVESSEALSTRLLKKYLLAIDTKISRLGECGRLFSAVMSVSWLGRDEAFVELYDRLLCHLAGVHSKYLTRMMESLVKHFAKLPSSLGRLPGELPVSRALMFKRVHMAIGQLVQTVPSGSNALSSAIRMNFPNDLETTRSYMQYQRHLLQIANEIPEVKSLILALLVQKLVAIDEQVQHDIEDMEDEEEDRLLQRPSSKDGDGEESDDSDIDSASESEETITAEEQRLRDVRLKVAKMDGTLDLMFEYYSPLIEKGVSPRSSPAYQELMAHFASFILPHRCRHAQFLQFHFALRSPGHTSMFVQQCLELAINRSGSAREKMTACAYIASFVARGAHIPRSSVREIFRLLCDYLDEMRAQYEPYCRAPDRRISSGLYYSVAQALLYIFCFRWQDLVTGSSNHEHDLDAAVDAEDILADGHELTWISGVQESLRANMHSKLNPLKVCSPSIVQEFAKIAHHLRFLYVFTLLESNKRLRLGHSSSYYGTAGLSDIGRRETAFDRKTGEAHHQLEAYFPFDPYHLPKSKRWVEGEYNEWKLPRGLRQDDEDEDSESEESDCESMEEDVTESPMDSVIAGQILT